MKPSGLGRGNVQLLLVRGGPEVLSVEFVLVPLYRKWHTDLPQGTCLLVSTSMDCEKLKVEGGVRAMVLTSQYLIEPCGMGRSKLTHICRADLR